MEHRHFKSQCHQKFNPLYYANYIVLQHIEDNSYCLEFPPQLGIHDVVNVNNMKLYVPSLLEDSNL
jgi:hypothetical protein